MNTIIFAHVNKPVHMVWDAFNLPKHIMNWNHASDTWHCPAAKNDLRVGGSGQNAGNGSSGQPGYTALTASVINITYAKLIANGGKGGNYYNSFGLVWRVAGGSGGNGGAKGVKGSFGTGSPVNGIGIGINFGQIYFDEENQPKDGVPGEPGIVLTAK
ncbi:hypothetical protein JV173_01150 [Acholeplasma equirhinis]|uniref:hypothetical protein n=1 Tax=Acholeplasma equirhinis TaxID=555393 RepID=UPI00197ADAA1|nr:hypothetical protein [Acholeplasma equirhinis]MBN3490111.1 hypothetical protein [Acholeplasma equirhinis]